MTELDLDAIERQILALIDRNEGSDVHTGVPPVLALGLVQRCRRAEAPKVMVSSPVDVGEMLVTVSKRRWDEAQGIVRDLAAVDPVITGSTATDGRSYCSLCGGQGDSSNPVKHTKSCVHHRAIEAGKS